MTFKKTIALASAVVGLALTPNLAFSAPVAASATIPAVDQSTLTFTPVYDNQGRLTRVEVTFTTTCGDIGCVD